VREIGAEEFKDFIKRSGLARAIKSSDSLDSVILLKSILKNKNSTLILNKVQFRVALLQIS